MKKLSQLQKTTLSMAKQQGYISNSDILKAVYGFEQTVYTRVIRFERQRIGMARYLAASAAVSRALTRLRNRGLMIRVKPAGYHVLTREGHEAVSLLLL
jgi:Mn-dependent DtxR family transcriptional regulator